MKRTRSPKCFARSADSQPRRVWKTSKACIARSSSPSSTVAFRTVTMPGMDSWNMASSLGLSSGSSSMARRLRLSIVLILTSTLSGSWMVELNSLYRSACLPGNESPADSSVVKMMYVPTSRCRASELVAACWRYPGRSAHSPSSKSWDAMAAMTRAAECRVRVTSSFSVNWNNWLRREFFWSAGRLAQCFVTSFLASTAANWRS